MLTAVLILAIGLTPSLVSVWVIRRSTAGSQARLGLAMDISTMRRLSRLSHSADYHYVEGTGYVIGDITCRFNAHSNYIRCAVNPFGPCQTCSSYESKSYF